MRQRTPHRARGRRQVLIYSGQLDIIIGAALTERFLQLCAHFAPAAHAIADLPRLVLLRAQRQLDGAGGLLEGAPPDLVRQQQPVGRGRVRLSMAELAPAHTHAATANQRPSFRFAGSYVRAVQSAAYSFTQVVIRDAGHIVPYDQPGAALDMVTRFVNDLPFSGVGHQQ